MRSLTSGKGPRSLGRETFEFCYLGFLMEIAQSTDSLISETH